jgi:hypothetical protein
MKKIILFQEGAERLELLDNSNENNLDYAKSLSYLLELPNISLLELSESVTVIRPSKIISITISDINNGEKNVNKKEIEDEDKDVIREC